MKFVVDANLPRRLCRWLASYGYDALHTLDLPAKNDTDDDDLYKLSCEQQRVVITKDADFAIWFLTGRRTPGLLIIATGNLSNDELILYLELHRERILENVKEGKMVELRRDTLVVFE